MVVVVTWLPHSFLAIGVNTGRPKNLMFERLTLMSPSKVSAFMSICTYDKCDIVVLSNEVWGLYYHWIAGSGTWYSSVLELLKLCKGSTLPIITIKLNLVYGTLHICQSQTYSSFRRHLKTYSIQPILHLSGRHNAPWFFYVTFVLYKSLTLTLKCVMLTTC